MKIHIPYNKTQLPLIYKGAISDADGYPRIQSGTIPSTVLYTGQTNKVHKLTDSTTLAERDTMYHLPPAMTVCSIFIQKSQPDPDCCMFDRCACNYPKFDGQATETFLS